MNANKFRKKQFLLLFTVVEKDESQITKDEHENDIYDDAAIIGSDDNALVI